MPAPQDESAGTAVPETALEDNQQTAQQAAESTPETDAAQVLPVQADQDNQVLTTPVEMLMTFNGDCWVNVEDATGEAIAFGVKKAGYVMPLTGRPPFVVTLGAPEVVTIVYEGVPVDMSQFPAGRTAKFDLPLGADSN